MATTSGHGEVAPRRAPTGALAGCRARKFAQDSGTCTAARNVMIGSSCFSLGIPGLTRYIVSCWQATSCTLIDSCMQHQLAKRSIDHCSCPSMARVLALATIIAAAVCVAVRCRCRAPATAGATPWRRTNPYERCTSAGAAVLQDVLLLATAPGVGNGGRHAMASDDPL
jgi:hypothetical protein